MAGGSQSSGQKNIKFGVANTSSGSKIKLSFPKLGQKEISTDEKNNKVTSFEEESISPPIFKVKRIDDIKVQDFDDVVHHT